MYARRVYWRLSPLPHPIIPHHFRNTQPIAAKHTASSRRLRTTMRASSQAQADALLGLTQARSTPVSLACACFGFAALNCLG